jgi:hypothetical protein
MDDLDGDDYESMTPAPALLCSRCGLSARALNEHCALCVMAERDELQQENVRLQVDLERERKKNRALIAWVERIAEAARRMNQEDAI